MKAYLMTTGTLFALLCVSHVYLTILAIGIARGDWASAELEGVVALVSGTLAIWAWKLLRGRGARS